jgi:hypothetical protein
MKTGRRRLLAGLALVVALGALAVGVVVNASDTTFESTTTTKSRYAKRLEHRENKHLSPRERRERFKRLFDGAERCKNHQSAPRTIPAQMLGPNSATDTPASVLWPVRNGWVVGDCHRETWVWVGGTVLADYLKNYRSNGRFIISRSGFPPPRDHATVDVPNSGPLKIINAPLGPDVVTSAQSGQLPFASKRGITGTLDLSADTVTLSTGEVIEGQHP